MGPENYDVTKFERPSVTVDVLIFTIKNGELKVVLVKRGAWPYEGKWAIPGGFVKMDESLEEAARRKLLEETGVKDVYLEQLYTFGDPQRDPRTRVITVTYFALTPEGNLNLHSSGQIEDTQLFPTNNLPELAFDHKQIIDSGVERLKAKVGYSNIAFGLLSKKFRLSELQKVYETILGHKVDKRNFRKKMISLGLVEATGEKEMEGAHRPAMLYQSTNKEVVFFD